MARGPNFPLAEAQIVSLFLVSITYGIYTVTAGLCARVLICGEIGRRLRVRLIVVAATMLVLTTLGEALCFYDVMRAFILNPGSGSPEEKLEELSDWGSVLKVRRHPFLQGCGIYASTIQTACLAAMSFIGVAALK